VNDPVDVETSQSIARGVAWGQAVTDDILAWRATDGFTPAPPPFLGGLAAGQWRPTPPGFLPGAAPQFATMTPWIIVSPAEFRPAGPPALTSAQYAADVNEVKALGSLTGSTRTPFQTEVAVFWNGNTALYWNRIALTMAAQRHTTLSENARLFALVNLALADAAIACWDGKYTYVFWRPITAIRLADTDGNPATDADPTWTPLLITPNHPDYPSGHATVSPAAAVVLQSFFGDSGPYTLDSELLPGVLHSFTSFAGAADEAFIARIYGGIHFRTACHDGHEVGVAVGRYIVANALQPLNGRRLGQTSHNHPGGLASVEGQGSADGF
jgi:PAP2 superfamily protein